MVDISTGNAFEATAWGLQWRRKEPSTTPHPPHSESCECLLLGEKHLILQAGKSLLQLCAVSSSLTIKKVSKLTSHWRSPASWALKWQARGWEQTKVCQAPSRQEECHRVGNAHKKRHKVFAMQYKDLNSISRNTFKKPGMVAYPVSPALGKQTGMPPGLPDMASLAYMVEFQASERLQQHKTSHMVPEEQQQS